MIRSSDVIWDYKKKNGHSFWEDVSARLSESLTQRASLQMQRAAFSISSTSFPKAKQTPARLR